MAALRPIPYKQFEQFLRAVGCRLVRQEFEIKSNLRTLRVSTQEYLSILEGL